MKQISKKIQLLTYIYNIAKLTFPLSLYSPDTRVIFDHHKVFKSLYNELGNANHINIIYQICHLCYCCCYCLNLIMTKIVSPMFKIFPSVQPVFVFTQQIPNTKLYSKFKRHLLLILRVVEGNLREISLLFLVWWKTMQRQSFEALYLPLAVQIAIILSIICRLFEMRLCSIHVLPKVLMIYSML